MTASKRHFVRANGVDLHVLELGPTGRADQPPLVLLHGISDSHLTWSRVARALAERRRVIMPDLPGHGLSGRPDASYALAWHAETIGALLDAMDLGEVDLAGHSYGGGVAQWMLLAHRERVRRMMLVASGGLGRDVSPELKLASLGIIERIGQPFFGVGTRIGLAAAGGHFEGFETDEIAWMASRPGTARAMSRTVSDVIDLGGQSRHFLQRAGEIATLPPIALVWGDRDRVLPFHHAVDSLEILEGAPLARYEGCGHFPHREEAERFAADIARFLEAEELPTPTLKRAVQVQIDFDPPPSAVVRAWRSVTRALRKLFGTHEAVPAGVLAEAAPADTAQAA